MRRIEQSADAPYKIKLIRGFYHLAIGQVCPLCLTLARFSSDVSISYRIFFHLGSHLSRPWVVYNLRRLGHHHLLLSSLCSPQWWYHFWRHWRASRAPNRHVQGKRWLYAHLHSAFLRWQWYCWRPSSHRRRHRFFSEIPKQCL